MVRRMQARLWGVIAADLGNGLGNRRDGSDSFSTASSESLGPAQSFFQRRIFFCAHGSVCGLRVSLLLRIGWARFIISVLENDHLHPLMAELFCFRLAGHVDIDVVAVYFPTRVFNGIVAGITASAINADAAV